MSARPEHDAHWREILTGPDMSGATAFLRFELIDFDSTDGWCEAYFTAGDETLNPAGNVQGGFIAAMLDEVMSVAGSIVQPGPAMVPTLQMTTNFLRPVPPGRLIGRGEVLRAGRTTLHTHGVLRDLTGTVLAEATAACVPRAL